MRIYYLFFINDYIYKQTKNNQLGLYKLFENIYFMKDKDAPERPIRSQKRDEKKNAEA